MMDREKKTKKLKDIEDELRAKAAHYSRSKKLPKVVEGNSFSKFRRDKFKACSKLRKKILKSL